MEKKLKVFAIKFGVALLCVAFLIGLFSYNPFVLWLHRLIGTAFGNIMLLLNALVPFLALAIVLSILWKSFKPKKGK